jgi:flagellar hook assembly protein FlgD
MKTKNKNAMKTKSMLVAVMMLMGIVTFGKDPVAPRLVVVNQKATGTFKVIYEGEKKGSVKMNILDAKGVLVFTETLKSVDGFIRPVNFSNMTPGQYTIEVIDANGKVIQQVNYVTETAVNNIHVAKIAEEGKYLLAVANQGSEEINVKIFDGSNNLVHNESVKVNGSLGLVYNLKKVAGNPTFEVTDKAGAVKTIKY